MFTRYLVTSTDVEALAISQQVAQQMGCGKKAGDVTRYWFSMHTVKDGRTVLHVDDRGAEKLAQTDRDELRDSLSPEMRPDDSLTRS